MMLSGFTLFRTGRGWQLSTREQGEEGWSVRVGYPEEDARKILALVGELLPDAPPPPRVAGRLDLRPARRARRILAD